MFNRIFCRRGPFQFLQFSMIGGLNALIDIGTLNVFLILYPTSDKVMLALYNTLAYTLAIMNSYAWNSRFTFRKGSTGRWRQKVGFLCQALVSLGINTSIFILVLSILEWAPVPHFLLPQWMFQNVAKGAAMILSSTASFFFMKYFVFTRKDKQGYRVIS